LPFSLLALLRALKISSGCWERDKSKWVEGHDPKTYLDLSTNHNTVDLHLFSKLSGTHNQGWQKNKTKNKLEQIEVHAVVQLNKNMMVMLVKTDSHHTLLNDWLDIWA
jgi:hypothetical protein